MRRKSPFHSLIVGVSCAMVGCILASTAYSRRVDELEIERDIYASRFQNWQMRAIDAEENASQLQTEVDNLTAELAAQIDLTLTYAGSFSCTAYCTEEYAHICGEGHGITSSGAKAQPGVTVAADTSILPYGTVIYIEGVGLRVVQDTGSAVVGNKLDVAVNTHAEALSWSGWGSHRVWMCELGNDHAGQFFTPYDVCRCMAEITFDPKLHPDMEGFISVSDPACGAGATLLAFLNVCKRRNICYHNKVLVIAQDIDFIVGLMCYIQCSFMGCAGYVVIGDTLTDPATAYDSRGLLPAGPQNRIWYMPFLSTDMWYMRRQIAQMNLLLEPKGEPAKIEKADTKPADLQKSIKNEPKAPENEPLNETKTGQLTFF